MEHTHLLQAAGSIETPNIHIMIRANDAADAKAQGAAIIKALHGKFFNYWLWDVETETAIHRYGVTVQPLIVD